jgi:transposase-like protein
MKGNCVFNMPKGKPIDPNLRAEIVSKIRNEGMSVSEASAQYGVNSKSIYYWLRDGVVDGNRNLILENNKLKKENEQLYKLLGRATAEMQKSKS